MKRAVIVVTTLAVLGGVYGPYWFFSGDAPEEVDLGRTASSVAGDPDGTTVGGEQGIDGTWVVDTSVGEFTLEDTTTASFAGFRIDEELRGIGATTAVGRTPQVSGTIIISDDEVSVAAVGADLRAIVSNESRRNGAIQRALGTSSHPEATFESTQPIQIGEGAAAGERVAATARGNLTVNGVTDEVVFDLEAQLIGGRILVTGRASIALSDFGITAPTAPMVLSVADTAVVELQLWFRRG